MRFLAYWEALTGWENNYFLLFFSVGELAAKSYQPRWEEICLSGSVFDNIKT